MAEQQSPEKSIFLSALEIGSEAERASFLEQACAGNPALRAAVEALLQAHEKPQQLLDDPLVAAPTIDQTQALESPGTVVGHYKLLEVIGEGGMGTVYMAQQTVPVKRLVAVKLIKPGMDTRQVLARFEAERQALALMEHPNIARVLDAGATASGRPYFVMELVKGMPLTKYCDEHRLAPRERLELFIPVCQAIQHAHQKGIIHRDIKPSNVLVASFDGKPVPKVIDFGVAKAAGQQLTERTLVTGFGAVVGTLEYMSPEQAELNQIDIDTRSDIYSLGVLLYELLTGSTPLEKKRLKEAAMLEVLRLIREEEPPRPSTRLSTTEELPSIAANRNLEPKKLSGLVRGELDWIAMKALDKDRNRRYETANGLAMDVQRYLADEPVQACPPSAGYRLRKFMRRNKGPVLAVSVILLALVGGIVGTTVGLLRAQNESLRATNERDEKEKARQAEAHQRIEADTARAGAEAALYRSLVSESRALLLSGREGWRAQALENLRRASAIDTAERDLAALRTEAVAALAGFDAERMAIERNFEGWSESIDFGTDSTRLALATESEVVLWDLRQGSLRRERTIALRGASDGNYSPVAPIPGVRFHPDGKQIAFNTWERAVEFESLVKDEATLPRIAGDGQPRSIAFDRQGRVLAVTWIDGQLGIYDAVTGKRIRSLQVAGANQWYQWMPVALSPDGQFVATVGADHSVEVRDLRTEKPPTVLGRHRNRVQSLCFSGDGRFLASASYDRMVKIWNVQGGEPVTLVGHIAQVTGVALSPDGVLAASASDDQVIRLWDTQTGRCLMTLPMRSSVACVAFSPDGKYLAAGGYKAVSLFRLKLHKECRQWTDVASNVPGLNFHPRQNLLAVGCADQTLTIRDADSGQIVRTLRANNSKQIGRVAFSPDGTMIAAASVFFTNIRSNDHDVRVWNALSGEISHLLKGHTGDVSSVAFDATGQRLAAAGVDGTVVIWDLESSAAVSKWLGPGPATTVRFFGNGARVLAWYPTGTVELRDAQHGTLIRHAAGLEGRPELDENSPALAIAPDERQMAVPCRDGAVRILTLPDLKLTATLDEAHRGPVYCVAFSPDGRWFVSVGEDRIVVLRDARTFQKLLAFPPRVGPVQALAFDRHSSTLAVSGQEEQVTLWNLDRIVDGLAGIGLAWEGATERELPARDLGSQLEVIPTGGAPHFLRGNELKAQGKLEEAIAEYRKATELDPKHLQSHWQLAGALKEAGRIEEAADDLSELIRQVPADANFRRTRAECYIAQKEWREAAADFAELSRQNPDDHRPPYHCAVALLAAQDRDGYRHTCAGALERFGKIEKPDAASHTVLTCMLAPDAVADFDPLIRLQEQFVAKNAGNWYFLVNLGGILFRAGRYEESVRTLDKSRAAHPNGGNGYDWYFLALAHHHLGHAEAARHWVEKAADWHIRATREQIGNSLTPTPLLWNDKVIMALLRREAEALILGKIEIQSPCPPERE